MGNGVAYKAEGEKSTISHTIGMGVGTKYVPKRF